jgi:hypothetical protein
MQSLLTGITPTDIQTDPFPHILVRDVMDPAVYAALSEGFPPFSKIGWDSPRPPPSNHRYQLSASQIVDHPDMSDVWKEFAVLHSSPAFFAQVVELFRDHWPQALKQHLGGSLLGHSMGLYQRDSHQDARILQDARIEINTPVSAGPSSSRGAHLDTSNRLFTGLLYLRHPDDDAVGGDLELFRWTRGPVAPLDSYCLPADAVEVVATIPYRPNQLVMFPQGLNALHGVGIRQPTPHTRRYVFISAELGEDWLTLPTAEAAQ